MSRPSSHCRGPWPAWCVSWGAVSWQCSTLVPGVNSSQHAECAVLDTANPCAATKLLLCQDPGDDSHGVVACWPPAAPRFSGGRVMRLMYRSLFRLWFVLGGDAIAARASRKEH